LVLAGQRAVTSDPLAEYSAIHKGLIDIHGLPMISHVLKTLRDHSALDQIMVIAPEELHKSFHEVPFYDDSIITLPAAGSPARSILQVLKGLPKGSDLIVTSCDHPLLNGRMIDVFLEHIDRTKVDVAVACVSQEVFQAQYPEARRTFIQFCDFQFSGANLFWLRAERANPLIQFWQNLEDNRKNPLKMAMTIGILSGLLYALGRLSRERAMVHIEKKTGARAALIPLPFANAAIDVDKPSDVELVRGLLRENIIE